MNSGYQYDDALRKRIETRFLDALRGHLAGWHTKVYEDFSEASFSKELKSLEGDAVYRQFAFARSEYVLVRLMGRVSISIGRRLGEIYDKLPRFVAAARFALAPSDVVERLDGLEVDLVLRASKLGQPDKTYVSDLVQRRFGPGTFASGLAIEIRYNFNPNDSARLRKDVQLADLVRREGLFPVYLIFSGISPRQEAIARLTRAGWHFLSGQEATDFTTELLGIDLMAILERPTIRGELEREVNSMMKAIFTSYAFKMACERYIQSRD